MRRHCRISPARPEHIHLPGRGHPYTMPTYTSDLFKNSFINRCLFSFLHIFYFMYTVFRAMFYFHCTLYAFACSIKRYFYFTLYRKNISIAFLCILFLFYIFNVFYRCDAQHVSIPLYAEHYKCLI